MIKIFQRTPFLLFACYIIFFCILYKILNDNLSLYTSHFSEVWAVIKQAKKPGAIFNNPVFWNSSAGFFIKLVIEILVVSAILYFSLVMFRCRKRFSILVAVTTISHSIFLFQYILEFLYFKSNPQLLQKINQESFSFLSCSYFLDIVKVKYPVFLTYFFKIISLFEIFYWLLMAYLISKVVKTEYRAGLKIVFSSYVPLLFIWLLVISFFTLMNSK